MIQNGSAAVEDKENKAGSRKARPSRIPRAARRPRAKAPLQSHNSTPSSSLSQQPLANSNVKAVPDFAKLHRVFEEKITQAKKKKNITEFKTFDLTPSSSRTASKVAQQTSGAEGERGRGNQGMTVTADFHHTSLFPSADSRTSTLRQGQPQAMSVSPRQQIHQSELIRQSVYSRRDRELRKQLQAPQPCQGPNPQCGRGTQGGHGEFSQLLQRLVQSTIPSVKTASRCPAASEAGLEGVKMKLEAHLGSLEEEEEELHDAARSSTPPPETPVGIVSRPHPLQINPHHHSPPLSVHCPPLSVYCEEPELCALVWKKYDASVRPSCPVARLLDLSYFPPLTKLM